jgi:hypothetical protein
VCALGFPETSLWSVFILFVFVFALLAFLCQKA